MAFLSNDEKRRLRQRIEAAERQTRGELVTVVARESDAYLYIPLLWASLVALSIPPVVVLADLWIDLATVSLIQLAAFLVLALLFRWRPVKLRLVPKATKLQRAGRAAREQFLARGVHNTSDRCGVLIYVSVGEHYVEILADRAISAKVTQAEWDAIVAAFVASVKKGEIAAGFEQAVDACGALLARHFPAAPGERNELPDHLIEL